MMDFVQLRLDQGDTLIETLQGTHAKLPDAGNPFRHTSRKVGQGSINKAPSNLIMKEHDILRQQAFESPKGADDYLTKLFADDANAQKILGVISRMWTKKPASFELEDLQGAYQDDLRTTLSKKDARPLLAKLCNHGLLQRDRRQGTNQQMIFVWSVKSKVALDGLLNEQLSDYV